MADQLLSQADVDALVASLSKNEAPKPAAPAPAPVAAKPVPVQAPASAPARPAVRAPVSMSSPAPRPAPASAKSEVSKEVVDGLNARVAELTKQLSNMSAAMKRMEMLEKKVANMEAKAALNGDVATTNLKVQQLTDEMKKIVGNLKGTPGYGIKNTFTCEKCDDHGHVAVQFRCTKCGKEKWYGWWPEKKK